jgi:putative ABC transport system substrate-binding protein
MFNVRRRRFITLLGAAAAAWPAAVQAQQSAIPVIGFLNSRSPDDSAHLVAAFRQGLRETGYLEGDNLAIEYRWAEGRYDRLPALAADLVRRQVRVLVASGGDPTALAAKEATASIPIVIDVGADPVALGLVASLNRPGGNITGVSILNGALALKLLELLHDLVPKAARIAYLANPNNPNYASYSQQLRTEALKMGKEVHILSVERESDFEPAFAALAHLRADALLVQGDPFINSRAEQLVTATARLGVPAVYPFREYVAAGGLVSYGTGLIDAYRLVGVYTGLIIKGAKPADLPIQQLVKVQMVINLKTAQALGLEIPPTLLARADEVIE